MENRSKEELCKVYDELTSSHSEVDLSSLDREFTRYENVEFYQKGGQKTIYRAYDVKTDRIVALAKLDTSATENEKALFLREARINAFLQHPNIIPVYDIGKDENELYFCMKFIVGETLSEVIDSISRHKQDYLEKFPLSECVEIFIKVCDAIAYAHDHGVLHLDLKPDNIRIDKFGDVLVCDWGLSSITDNSEIVDEDQGCLEDVSFMKSDANQMTLSGYIKGSLGYMAPEQTAQTSDRKTELTDVYSLGAILYSILCHKRPFEGAVEEVLSKTKAGDFTTPQQVRNDVPNALEAICLKAMQTKPEDRYQNIEELQKDLVAYKSGYATSAETLSFYKLAHLAFKRNKALSYSLLASFLVLLSISLIYIFSLKEKQEEASFERNKAVENLKMYKKEKGMKELLSDIGIDFFMNIAKEKMVIHQFDQAYDLLDKIPRSEYNDKQLIELNAILGKIAFISQKFELASELLNKGESEEKYLTKLAIKYKEKKSSDDVLLSGEDFVRLMNTLEFRDIHIVGDLFTYYKKNFDDIREFIKVSRGYIYIQDNTIKNVTLTLNEVNNKFYLDASNNPTLEYIPGLPGLKLHGLNLSNSGMEKIKFVWLTRMPLEELNLSGCGVKDYSFLSKCRSLKKIIVNKKESRLDSFKKHSKKLEVIIQD